MKSGYPGVSTKWIPVFLTHSIESGVVGGVDGKADPAVAVSPLCLALTYSKAGMSASKQGPLTGLRILEIEAIGPVPFCGMMLSDMGADVLLVDRVQDGGLGFNRERWYDVMLRGRRSVTLDLKNQSGVDAALALVDKADALLEGFR